MHSSPVSAGHVLMKKITQSHFNVTKPKQHSAVNTHKNFEELGKKCRGSGIALLLFQDDKPILVVAIGQTCKIFLTFLMIPYAQPSYSYLGKGQLKTYLRPFPYKIPISWYIASDLNRGIEKKRTIACWFQWPRGFF